ncbi:Lipoprotein [Cupriavidus sp. H19C3]
MSANGSLSVSDFKYLPAEPSAQGQVPVNVIKNTAIGTIKIDKDVSKYVRDAVFAELRFVGIQTNDKRHVLSGEIQEFLIDDLGYSVDWTLTIKYVLTDASSKTVVFDAVKETKRKTAKFVNVFGAMNETVKLNVEELLKDSRFQAAIESDKKLASGAR